ncbi:bis-aminopropyl spermidine synthase family protein [Brevibacillus humidisoli]|uniref:bis-aminopropyl spermidine synthase family protein n=1 Tax=Brevibacillus humidisoli TaxID=2895522 RepID=UPI001E306041|nr:bis-aminopropyl spermidine synthase family protein [Brevibacillus humidisoli]UFJ40467.1 bis-aminopropyl spermidine synthase family protein [Brevibacillus humidisoli]
MKQYLEEISSRVSLQEGPGALEQLIIACYIRPGISTKELARTLRLPVPVTAAVKKELIKAGLLEQKRGVHCTVTCKAYLDTEWGFMGMNHRLYRELMADQTGTSPIIKEMQSRLTPYFSARPSVDVRIDQSKCTVDTSLRRALLCLQHDALIGKNVLCLGDDDLVCVSLGFLLKQLFPRVQRQKTTITVVDVDKRILRHIEEIAEVEQLPIRCIRADLRRPLPSGMQGQFDAFFTDPPYTLQGMMLFLSRGISALKHQTGLPIFFSFAHKSPGFSLTMQRSLVQMGLMVSEIIPQFNQYEGAEMIGNRGQMIILKTTEETSPHVIADYDDALYTGELKRTMRTYQCKQCGISIFVGAQGMYATIEELKRQGCPACPNNTFLLLGTEMLPKDGQR